MADDSKLELVSHPVGSPEKIEYKTYSGSEPITRIEQDVKVAVGITREFLKSQSGGTLNLTVINAGAAVTINSPSGASVMEPQAKLPDTSPKPIKDLCDLLESLPGNKFHEMEKLMVGMARDMFELDKDAAKWLGITKREMSWKVRKYNLPRRGWAK